MQTLRSLEQFNHPQVEFDPHNPEHINAFKMLVIGVPGDDGVVRFRQHPTLRFKVNLPHTNVRNMMLEVIARHYIDTLSK